MSLALRPTPLHTSTVISAPQASGLMLAGTGQRACAEPGVSAHHHRHHGGTGCRRSLACRPCALGVFAAPPSASPPSAPCSFSRASLNRLRGILAAPCWWRFRWRLRWSAPSAGGHGLLACRHWAGADWRASAPAFWCARCSYRPPLCAVALSPPPRQAQPPMGSVGWHKEFTGTPLAWLVEQSPWRWGSGCWRPGGAWPGP